MKNGHNNIFISKWFRFCILLAFVYSSQVCSFYHSVHSHEESSIEYASLPIALDLEHSLYHHHHHKTLPQNDDHQHAYVKHINWHVIRTQFQNKLTIDDQFAFSSISLMLSGDNNLSYCDFVELPFLDECDASSSIIRGPPFLG